MKKRALSLILVLVLLITSAVPVCAKTTYTHYYLPLLNDPSAKFDFLVPSDNSGVLIRVDEIKDFINKGPYDFGFVLNQDNDQFSLSSSLFNFVLIFNFGSKKAELYLKGFKYEYTMPAKAVEYMGFAWAPFEFLLNIFDIPYTLKYEGIEMSPPCFNTLMALSYIYNNKDLSFDWIKEFGYSETNLKLMTGGARTVNLFSDLLSKDFLSRWLDIGTVMFTGESYFNDRQMAKKISNLFTNPSFSEVVDVNDSVIYQEAETLDSTIDLLEPVLDATDLKEKKILTFDDFYRLLEKFLDQFPEYRKNKQFGRMCDYISENLPTLGGIQFKLDIFSDIVMFISYAAEIYNYCLAFDNKNLASADALKSYAVALDRNVSSAIEDYADTVVSSEAKDILINYFKEHIDEIVVDALPLTRIIGAGPLLLLMGWDFVSKSFPYIRDSLESTDQFEVSEHAIAHQTNAYNLSKTEYSKLYSSYGAKNVKRSDLKNYIDLTYSYLKFSVIARNSALAAATTGNQLNQNTKDYFTRELNETNATLCALLSALENAQSLYLPEDVDTNKRSWFNIMTVRTLEAEGLEIVNLNEMTTESPYYNEGGIDNSFEYESGMITEEEAIEMVKEVMGASYASLLFDSLLESIYDFEVVDTINVYETSQNAYVIALSYSGEAYYYHLFVPVDGSAVWIGWQEDDGSYYCYPYIDMYNMSYEEIFAALTDMFIEAQLSNY